MFRLRPLTRAAPVRRGRAQNRRTQRLAVPASAASRPTLAVVGQPLATGTGMAGETYAQTGLPVELRIAYRGSLPNGAKLQLRSQAKYLAPYVASHVRVKLHGGRATLHVTVTAAMEAAAGSAVRSYEIAAVSHGHVLATSTAVSVFWAVPPPAVEVLEGSSGGQFATATTTTGVVTCGFGSSSASACQDTAAYPGEVFFSAEVTAPDLPPMWTVKLLFNGQAVCTNTTLQGTCSGMITVPANAPVGQPNPLTADLVSPQGKTTAATINITNTGKN